MPDYAASMFATADPGRGVKLWIDSFVQQANRVRGPLEPGWRENWANWRVEPFINAGHEAAKMNPYGPDRTSGAFIGALKTPESHQIGNTLIAVLLASLFGVQNYIEAEPVGDEDIEKAALVSKLVMYGLERPGNFRTIYDTLKDAVIFGTGLYRSGWVTKTRPVLRRMPIPDGSGGFVLNPETGQPVTILQNVEVATEDDYRQWPVNLWRAWLDPSHARLPEMDGICEMFTIQKDDLVALRGDPTWMADGIDTVLRGEGTYLPPSGSQTGTPPKLLTEQLTEDDVKGVRAFGYYGGWRYFGRVPSELAAPLGLDPRMSVQLSMIGDTVVQATQNPQKDGELPYGSLTILPNSEIPYGLSPLTVVRHLQDVADTQLILTVHAMVEAVYQNYLIGGSAAVMPGFKQALERRKPRETFMVPGDITQVVPLPKDYAGLNIAAQGLNLLSQTMRDASNARDPVQGVMSNDRSTATEVQTVAGAALQNVDQIAVLIERDELPRMAKLCYDAYYINLDDEAKYFKRIGDSEMGRATFTDIDGRFDLHFTGARRALTKGTKANQARDFFTMMMSNPLTASSLDVLGFVKWYQDECLEVRGMDRFIITDQDEVLARMQAMGVNGPIQGQGGTTPPGEGTEAQMGGEAMV